MTATNGPEGPHPTYRQMTLGECIALARYASYTAVPPGRAVDVDELTYLLDHVPVCETCGWTLEAHLSSHHALTCGQFVNSLTHRSNHKG